MFVRYKPCILNTQQVHYYNIYNKENKMCNEDEPYSIVDTDVLAIVEAIEEILYGTDVDELDFSDNLDED